MAADAKTAVPSLAVPSIALLVLNLWDAMATLTWVRMSLATEANPLMAWALDGSPLLFLALKLLLVQGGALLLIYNARSRVARGALWAGLCMYAVLGAYHLAFLARLLSN